MGRNESPAAVLADADRNKTPRRMNAGVRVFLYALILTLFASGAAFEKNVFGYTPLYFLLILSVFSLLFAVKRLIQVKVSLSLPAGFRRGVEEKLRISAENRGEGTLPGTTLELLAGGARQKFSFSVPGYEEIFLEARVTFRHVGIYPVQVKRIRVPGLLGILNPGKKGPLQCAAVLPGLYKIGYLPLHRRGLRSDEQIPESVKNRIPESYDGVREYVPGDSLKNIHWKLTAHSGQIMSKLYETARKDCVVILVDLSAPGKTTDLKERYDCLSETAVSVAWHALNQKFVSRVVFASKDGGDFLVSDTGGLSKMAYYFAHSRLEGKQSLENAMMEILKSSAPENVVVCTAELTQEIVYAASRLAAGGAGVTLLCAQRNAGLAESAEISRFLMKSGVRLHLLASARELSKIRMPEMADRRGGSL